MPSNVQNTILIQYKRKLSEWDIQRQKLMAYTQHRKQNYRWTSFDRWQYTNRLKDYFPQNLITSTPLQFKLVKQLIFWQYFKRQQLKTWRLINFQCMIMYQQRKFQVTAQECIFIFFYFRKLIIVDCTQLKQLVSILQAGVKGVHVNNIQFRDSSSSRYGSQNTKMQLTLIIAVLSSCPESQQLYKYVDLCTPNCPLHSFRFRFPNCCIFPKVDFCNQK
ncbi:Hypothetical_protein [Hexamita inflata]|uniref:Hypothetical_protein n=1 Tax=Hexamita inflata TaxID=28002 RepID=A0AA86QZ54_9EUKA|nr:Hypothetical protein HINF_LOCUS50857 [Hexamita inflata]